MVWSIDVAQVAASNANFTSLVLSPSGTGGSWKKSPVMTSWMPPQGRPLLRRIRPIWESLSKSSPSTIDTSSMIRVFVRSQRFLAFGFRRIFLTSAWTSSFPSPMPAKLCRVMPPMLHAASPVEAVTASLSGSLVHFFFSSWMMALIKTDLPVPAGPVKNTLAFLVQTRFLTWHCSLLKEIAADLTGPWDAVEPRASSTDASPPGTDCFLLCPFSCLFCSLTALAVVFQGSGPSCLAGRGVATGVALALVSSLTVSLDDCQCLGMVRFLATGAAARGSSSGDARFDAGLAVGA